MCQTRPSFYRTTISKILGGPDIAIVTTSGGWSLLRPGVPTLADVFRRNGYRTGIFGKWRLGENHPMRPSERGFDESVVCRGGGVQQSPDYWGNHYFDDHYYAANSPKQYHGYCTDVFFREATSFVQRHRDRPFFLYLPTNAPHEPYLVDERDIRPYKERGVPFADSRILGNYREHRRECRPAPEVSRRREAGR